MRPLNKREKVFAALIVAALVYAVGQYVVLEPQSRKLQKARAELEAAKQKFATLAPKIADFRNISLEVAKKERELAEAKKVFANEAEFAGVIAEVSRQAKTHGLQIQQLRPQQPTFLPTRGGGRGKFRQSDISLKIRGRYEQLGKFLGALEQEPIFLKITELHLERGQAKAPLLDIRLQLMTIGQS